MGKTLDFIPRPEEGSGREKRKKRGRKGEKDLKKKKRNQELGTCTSQAS
jgi:hypothetical protein